MNHNHNHKHDFEEITDKKLSLHYLKCKTCKKVSILDKPPIKNKGCFGNLERGWEKINNTKVEKISRKRFAHKKRSKHER